jgi:hypothetical protein
MQRKRNEDENVTKALLSEFSRHKISIQVSEVLLDEAV